MPVYLMKMEAKGPKDFLSGQRSDVFASQYKLFHVDSQFETEREQILWKVDDELRERASKLVMDQGAEQVSWSGGVQMEISKERLLELAEYARTRDEIEAEREPHRTL